MRITSAGNVGIATTSPAYKLDVNGAASFNDNLVHGVGTPSVSTDAANKSYVDTAVANVTSTGVTNSGGGTANYFPFWASGTALSSTSTIYQSGGNVGIGTTNPGYKLDVPGGSMHGGNLTLDTQIGGTDGILYFPVTPAIYSNGNSTSNVIGIVSNSGFANQGAVAQIQLNQKTANANDITAGVHLVVGGWYQNSGLAIPVYFGGGFASDNPVLAVVPTNSNGQGNVGVQTSTPQYVLDVNGQGTFNGNVLHGIGTPAASTDAANKSYVDTLVNGGGGTAWTVSGGNTYVSPTSQNVGIGTSTPSSPLYIYGSGDVPIIHLFSSTNNVDAFVQSAGSESEMNFGTISNHSVALFTDNQQRLTVLNSGNVGIGTTNPGQKLDVAARAQFRSDGTNGAGFWLTDSAGSENVFSGLEGPASSSNWGIWSNGAWQFTVANSGNVGIGTTGPQGKLQVLASGAYTNDFSNHLNLTDAASTTKNLALGFDGTNNIGWIQAINSGVVYEPLVLNARGGNVGIGTVSPGYTLDVNGAGSFESNVLHGVGTPAASTDAANKSYVDTAVGSLSGSKLHILDVPMHGQPVGERDYLIATLPASAANTGDAVYIRVTGLTGCCNGEGVLTVALGQRNGFWYTKSYNGGGIPGVVVKSYLQTDNTTNVYVVNPASNYYSGKVWYYEYGWESGNGGGATLFDPTATSTITGTLNFDSSNESTYPVSDTFAASNIGIGTTSPSQLLTINSGATPSTSQFDITSGGGALSALNYSADNESVGFDVDFASGAWKARNASVAWLYKSGGILQIQGSAGNTVGGTATQNSYLAVNLTSGNVGIATTSPAYTLSVNGQGTFNGNVLHGIGTPAASTDAANKSYVDTLVNGGGGTAWTVSGSDTYVNPTTQNVGIGTTSPGARLDVEGGGIISAGAMYLNGSSVNSGNTSLILNNGLSGETYALTAGIPNVAQTGFSISKLTGYSYGGGIQTSSTPIFTINGGNVGIGTTNPHQSLEVNGNIRLTPTTSVIEWGGNTLGLHADADAIGVLALQGTTTYAPRFDIFNAGNSSAVIRFDAGSGSPSFINNAGNFGIATTSPQYPLDVNGAGTFENNVLHGIATPAASTDAANKSYVDTATANGGGTAWSVSGSNTYVNPTTQNVIVGATSAAAGNFSVFSGAGDVGFLNGLSSPNRGELYYDTDGTGWKFSIGKYQSSAYTAQMTFQDNGNVGIGTTSNLVAPLNVVSSAPNGNYLANYYLGIAQNPIGGYYVLLIPTPTGSSGSPAAFMNGILTLSRGNAAASERNAAFYLSVGGSYSAGDYNASIMPLNQDPGTPAYPNIVTLTYGGVQYLALDLTSISNNWIAEANISFTGNWVNNVNSQAPTVVASSTVSSIATVRNYLDFGGTIALQGSGYPYNVGIATTSPAYTLSVNGQGTFNGNVLHGIGTPAASTDAANKSYVDTLVN
ncbi:MAG: hypothetical protein KGI73_04835, partial [Patescibacteria group bacterium]|nr:hypothetical protein [Patescibacteria group bacterium]